MEDKEKEFGGNEMNGKDIIYLFFWVGALFCTMIVWMYWHHVSAALYSFAIVLLLFMMDELFYYNPPEKVNKDDIN